MYKVLRILRDVALERGKRNEDRFFEAMNEASAKDDLPPWIRGALRPTSSQDKFEGIDAIVKTDVGKLFVQIKSSKAGKEHFLNGRHHQRNKSIVVIIIGEADTPHDIRAKARRLLSELRWQFLSHMSRVCNKQGS